MIVSLLPGFALDVYALPNSEDVDINSSYSGFEPWRPYPNPDGADPVSDQQTGRPALDIVGNEQYPPSYIAFMDEGETVAVRIRINTCDGNASNPEFKGFAYIGLDVTGNGAIDFFLGVLNPTSKNGRVAVYLADPSLSNTGPGNTGVTKPIASFQPRDGINCSLIKVDYSKDQGGKTPTDPGFPGFAINGQGGGDPDYFVTFVFNLNDINAALDKAGKPELKIDPDKAFTYIVGTAAQDNSLNGDVNGMNGITNGPWPFTPPVSTKGIEYYAVNFDRTLGDRDPSPMMVSVMDGETMADAEIELPSPPRKLATHEGTADYYWSFVGWSKNDDNNYDWEIDYLFLDAPIPPGALVDPTTVKIEEATTFYAVWRKTTDQVLAAEDTVHFNPAGGSWSNNPGGIYEGDEWGTKYWHRDTIDGIVDSFPPAPSPPATAINNLNLGVSIPGGQLANYSYRFAGWVTEYKRWQTGNNEYNIIVLPNGTIPAVGGTLPFYIWSQLVKDLNTPEGNLAKGSPTWTYPPDSHSGEPTVYALWAVTHNTVPKYDFYDNIYETATSPYFGSFLFSMYCSTSGGAVVGAPAPISRQGYTFRGWSTNSMATVGMYLDPLGANASLANLSGSGTTTNLYAIWQPNPYAVVFNSNIYDMSGAVMTGVSGRLEDQYYAERSCLNNTSGIHYGTTVPGVDSWPANPEPPANSYMFRGWNTDPEGFGLWINTDDMMRFSSLTDWRKYDAVGNLLYPVPVTPYSGNATVEGYTTVYAIWERDLGREHQFRVTFDAVGGMFLDTDNRFTTIRPYDTDEGKYENLGFNPDWVNTLGDSLYSWRRSYHADPHTGRIDGGAYISDAPPVWPTGEYIFVGWSLDPPRGTANDYDWINDEAIRGSYEWSLREMYDGNDEYNTNNYLIPFFHSHVYRDEPCKNFEPNMDTHKFHPGGPYGDRIYQDNDPVKYPIGVPIYDPVFTKFTEDELCDRTVLFYHPLATSQSFDGETFVYAVWAPTPPAHQVTFWPNSGEWPGDWHQGNEGNDSISVLTDEYGVVYYVPYSGTPLGPQKEYFEFAGWKLRPDGLGPEFRPDMDIMDPLFSDYLVEVMGPNPDFDTGQPAHPETNPQEILIKTLNVYAQWVSAVSGKVVISFLMNDGSDGDSAFYTYEAGIDTNYPGGLQSSNLVDPGPVIKPTDPVGINGWVFKGWFKDEACTEEWNFVSDTVSEDVTFLYAGWLRGSATVFIELDGSPWRSSGKVIRLELGGGTFITLRNNNDGSYSTSESIDPGVYAIYDGEDGTIDTGVTITLSSGGDNEATLDYYTLTLTAGTGITAVTGGGIYLSGTKAVIDATVDTINGYTWANWTNNAGGSVYSATKNYTDVEMTGALNLTANATRDSGTATVTAMLDGSIWTAVTGIAITLDDGAYTLASGGDGTFTTSTAIPTGTYAIYADGVDTGVSVTVTTAGGSATIDYYTLTLTAGTGITAVTGGGIYLAGASVMINATVDGGYTWYKWEDTNGTAFGDSYTRNLTFSMPSYALELEATATATPDAVTVNVFKDGAGWTGQDVRISLNGSTFITLTEGASGVYSAAGVTPGSYKIYKDGVDTGKTLLVTNADSSADLNYYTLTVVAGTGVESVTGSGVFMAGDKVPVGAKSAGGHIFDYWTPSPGSFTIPTTPTVSGPTITMPAYALTLTAYAKAPPVTLILSADYTVEHYLVSSGGVVSATPHETEILNGIIGTTVTAANKNGYIGYSGYSYSEGATGEVKSGVIKANGSLVLRLYYKQNSHEIKYEIVPGGHTPTGPGAPAIPAPTTAAFGSPQNVESGTSTYTDTNTSTTYTFVIWGTSDVQVSGSSFTMPDNPVTFFGDWIPSGTAREYQVEHYLIDANNIATLHETERHYGTGGETVAATPKTGYVGYTYVTPYPGEVLSGTIVDDSLVLKLYYAIGKYKITYEIDGSEVAAELDVPFGATRAVRPEPAGIPGFVFSKWSSGECPVDGAGNFTMPAKNVVFKGSWMPLPYIYIVRFVDWNGNHIKTEYVPEGWNATAPANPARHDHTFTGWDKVYNNVTTDIIVMALYKPKSNGNGNGNGNGGYPPPFTPPPEIPLPLLLPLPVAPVEVDEEMDLGSAPDYGAIVSEEIIEDEKDENENIFAALSSTSAEIVSSPFHSYIHADLLPGGAFRSWAVLNLLLTLITCLIMAALMLTYYRGHMLKAKGGADYDKYGEDYEYEDEYSGKVKNYPIYRMLSIATSIAAFFLFLSTQDMRLPMVFTDMWTIYHIGITAFTVFLASMSRKKYIAESDELYDAVLD